MKINRTDERIWDFLKRVTDTLVTQNLVLAPLLVNIKKLRSFFKQQTKA